MRLLSWMRDNRWSFSLLGVLALWALLSVMTSHFNLNSLSGVASSASFLMIVAIGQMFVIAGGNGNIDLSIPSVITVSAFATMILSKGTNAGLILALPAVLAIGLVTGAANAFLIQKLRIPAIIATLAIGYVLDSATLIANRALDSFTVSSLLHGITAAKMAGVPLILMLAALLIIVAGGILTSTSYGRNLMAVGQNRTAAHLAGAPVGRTITITFLVSGVLGALDGALLSAHAGGAILLVLVVTTMQVSGWSPGMQEVVQGAVVIAILAAAGSGIRRRSA